MTYHPDPIDYTCSNCKAEGVRLWRPYPNGSKVRCYRCMKLEYKNEPDDASGQWGWYVAAVPTHDGSDGYWGYLGIPEEGATWWRALPLHNDCAGCGQNPCTGNFTQCRNRNTQYTQYETRVYAMDPEGNQILLLKSHDKAVAQAAIKETKP